MILPDQKIYEAVKSGRIGIDPFDAECIKPASYDMKLDRYFRFYSRLQITNDETEPNIIDLKSPRRMTKQVEATQFFELGPHEFVLASSIETFRFPPHIAGRCEGKSSLGRVGLTIHVTAGFFDPGFEGTATLELFNANRYPIRMYPGMPVAQMSFHQMDGRSTVPYGMSGGSKYHRQGIEEPGPKESEFWRNFKPDTICSVCGQVGGHDLLCAEGRDEEERKFHRSEYEGNWTPEQPSLFHEDVRGGNSTTGGL